MQKLVLAKFPRWMAPWKRGIKRIQGRNFFYALAEEAISKETSTFPFYSKLVFSQREKYDLTDLEVSALTGNLFGAGSDTSSSTLITFILACTAFPEVLPRAWEELDRVVGDQRVPDLDDEDDLPYVRAFVKEVFRWRPVAVLGGQPHAGIKDDIYNVSKRTTPEKWRDRMCVRELTSASRAILFQKIRGSKATSGASIATKKTSLTQTVSSPVDSLKTTLIIVPSRTKRGICHLDGEEEFVLAKL